MKRYLLTALFVLISSVSWGKTYWFSATSFNGGSTGALDAINGTPLSDGDKAIVVTASGRTCFYNLDADSGLTEDSTDYGVISPDSNAGDKRWIRAWCGPRSAIPDSTIDQGDSSVVGTIAWHVADLSDNSGDIYLHDGTYKVATAIELTENIRIIGTHVPAQDSPGTVAQIDGTIISRSTDNAVFTMTGTNRTTDRVGHVLIQGIAFQTSLDASSEAVIDAKYADNVLIKQCSFWENDSSTTVGHVIDVEECWDWRFEDVIWKYYGNSGGTKHAVRLYNGDDNRSNHFIFDNCKWYSGTGKAIYSDTSGGGDAYNDQVYINNCKFEENTTDDALVYISGRINELKVRNSFFSDGGGGFISNEMRHAVIDSNAFGGGTTRFLSLVSTHSNWRITNNYFTAPDAGPTEAIYLDGAQEIVITGNHFVGVGANYTRFIHLDGSAGGNELRGVIVKNNTAWESAYLTTPMVGVTGALHATTIIEDNGGYQVDIATFTNGDATPSVAGYTTFKTFTNALTITDFDNGVAGKVITVISKGAITFDTTTAQDASHNLDGSSANIVTASGDVTVWVCEDGTTWHLIRFNDASSDHSDDG